MGPGRGCPAMRPRRQWGMPRGQSKVRSEHPALPGANSSRGSRSQDPEHGSLGNRCRVPASLAHAAARALPERASLVGECKHVSPGGGCITRRPRTGPGVQLHAQGPTVPSQTPTRGRIGPLLRPKAMANMVPEPICTHPPFQCANGDYDTVLARLDKGNTQAMAKRDRHGFSGLHAAAGNGQTAIVALLLSRNWPTTIKTEGVRTTRLLLQ
eukprot:scaffold563_cov410-Prasinococcus_capsulatus_cf.AAC.18